METDDDPTAIRSIAVHAEDVVAALEANLRRDAGAVLRVTPPFSGRMRARIHAGETGYDGTPAPVHIDPSALVSSVPDYPSPDGTEDELRTSDEAYTVERHRERHTERIEAWRATVRERIVDVVAIETPTGEHEVSVVGLG